MTLLEFPRFVVGELGLRMVEVWDAHFDDTSDAYCRALDQAARAAGATITNIQLDFTRYDLASTDAAERAQSIATISRWMDRAKLCGASSIRANTDGPRNGRPYDARRLADSFRQLAKYGSGVGVTVLVENHFGYSTDIANIVEILELVDHSHCKALADWGNLKASDTAGRIRELSPLFPRLGFVSAKGMRFDAEYRHADYDIGAIVRATEAAGYRGIYSIELWPANPADAPQDTARAVRSMRTVIAANLSTSSFDSINECFEEHPDEFA